MSRNEVGYTEGRCKSCKRFNTLTMERNEKGKDVWLCIFCALAKVTGETITSNDSDYNETIKYFLEGKSKIKGTSTIKVVGDKYKIVDEIKKGDK